MFSWVEESHHMSLVGSDPPTHHENHSAHILWRPTFFLRTRPLQYHLLRLSLTTYSSPLCCLALVPHSLLLFESRYQTWGGKSVCTSYVHSDSLVVTSLLLKYILRVHSVVVLIGYEPCNALPLPTVIDTRRCYHCCGQTPPTAVDDLAVSLASPIVAFRRSYIGRDNFSCARSP